MPQDVFDVIERFAMLATTLYLHQKESKVWLQEKVTKSDNHYLATQIRSFIVLCVCTAEEFLEKRRILGKGMAFKSGIVFVHRKGMVFKIRHGLCTEKEHGLSVQA